MHTEIVKRINDLPVLERMEIVEEVTRSVNRDLRDASKQKGDRDATIKKRREAVNRLKGIAAVAGKTPPTDEEVKTEYYDYLAKKYE